MSDFIDCCSNCGRFIAISDDYHEERNDYGYPILICEVCQKRDSTAVIAPEYLGTGVRAPNCSFTKT